MIPSFMFERNATAIHIVCSFCVDDKNIVCATSRTIERMYCKKKVHKISVIVCLVTNKSLLKHLCVNCVRQYIAIIAVSLYCVQ